MTIFHGACLGCIKQYQMGIEYCNGCQFQNCNWDLPDLSQYADNLIESDDSSISTDTSMNEINKSSATTATIYINNCKLCRQYTEVDKDTQLCNDCFETYKIVKLRKLDKNKTNRYIEI